MRIVSLCPSLTELLFDLGRGDDLVGVPPGAYTAAGGRCDRESRGTKNPDIDRISAYPEIEPAELAAAVRKRPARRQPRRARRTRVGRPDSSRGARALPA